jgi:hypothetical protein
MFFKKKYVLWAVVAILLIVVGFLFYINTPISNLIGAVFGSIVASVIVSSIYNDQLHNAMDKYQRIGLINYFENFEDVQNEIRIRISNAKKVDIYVMYADRFFNTTSNAFTSLLAKENTKLRCFIYSPSNKFIEGYGNHWGDELNEPEYSSEGIIKKIENVVKLIKKLNEKKNNNSTVELYQIQSAPVSYSFYKIDNELYFVPSKNIRSKEVKPAVFHFEKTRMADTMFSKIETEINAMITNNEVIRMDL